ncbi:MAG: 2-oxoacid:ferredoxin oxidoreductase subunit beta [Planctomycetota bacterium]|nr:MAG: 2-oxoacid:ferredoxin oxidoreductase subunit beta [Planctomycetota bacterium]
MCATKTVRRRRRRTQTKRHPLEKYLRMERIPHIWCPGCGIGTVMNAFCTAVMELESEGKIEQKKIAVVSGIGCSGRAAGYLRFDSFHTTHGGALPFAAGLKLANPDLTVVVISGDGDIVAIGGNHLIHAARRNVDFNVICINNFIYGMTGGQVAPTTPLGARSSTTPYGNYEIPFNLPHLAASAGAVYVARWTTLHARRLKDSMKEALLKRGFCFIEAISPCPTVFIRRNRLGSGIDVMRMFAERAIVEKNPDPNRADIDLRRDEPIICGKFVDIERPNFLDLLAQQAKRS